MNKTINYVLGVLIASAICSGAWAVVKVYVQEATIDRIDRNVETLVKMHMVK